jgi:hypothetical protein
LVGLNTAFALSAALALWRANKAWSSPMISSAADSGIMSSSVSRPSKFQVACEDLLTEPCMGRIKFRVYRPVLPS